MSDTLDPNNVQAQPRQKGGLVARKTKPIGYVARCQCGEILGAMDHTRTLPIDAGKILGEWLHEGLTIEPRWGNWSEIITACKCK